MNADPYSAVRAEAAKTYLRRFPTWAQATDPDHGFPVGFPIRNLGATDSDADHEGTLGRARAWTEYDGPGRVETIRRKWSGFGVLDVPCRLVFNTASDVASFTGHPRAWDTAVARILMLRTDWPEVGELPIAVFTKVMSLADADWATVLAALRWADGNDTAGFLARQLPVPGADTKWVERNWPLIDKLSACGARTNPNALAPLNTIEQMTFTHVLDDGLRLQIGGLGMFTAPPSELAKLRLTPHTVIICENLQNGHAFTDRPGTVVLAGKGFDVTAYARIPWVRAARILYWGDIDTHGFAILNRFRAHLPATSILMDVETLLSNRAAWVVEDKPTAASLPNLTDQEQRLYRALVNGVHGINVRFEQERVPWTDVSQALVNLSGPERADE